MTLTQLYDQLRNRHPEYVKNLRDLSRDDQGLPVLAAGSVAASCEALDFDLITRELHLITGKAATVKSNRHSSDALFLVKGGGENVALAEFKNACLRMEVSDSEDESKIGGEAKSGCKGCRRLRQLYRREREKCTAKTNKVTGKELRLKALESAWTCLELAGCAVQELQEHCDYLLVYSAEKNPGLVDTLKAYAGYGDTRENRKSGKNRELVHFCLDLYIGSLYREVHTYTAEEFESYLKRKDLKKQLPELR